jgi:tRNA dimethylallyltransferase
MIEELGQIIDSGISFEILESLGLETKYIGYFLQNKISYDEMIETLSVKTGQYAKRQMTWFRRNEKIRWINPLSENLCSSVESVIIRDSKPQLPY